MNICICMYYDPKIKSFADINYKINEIYCRKYGYDIIKSNIRSYKKKKESSLGKNTDDFK